MPAVKEILQKQIQGVNVMENLGYAPEELMPVVEKLAFRYTGCDHSSVSYERAQMLMEAVLYCIREFRQSQGDALMAKDIPAGEAYRRGQEIVMEKVRELFSLYNEMIPDFKDYGCLCLRDTVRKGTHAFLKSYDFTFAPQETLLTLDYPVREHLEHLCGVDRVLSYMKCICAEQEYLGGMDEREVIAILRGYHREYGYLMENICEIVKKRRADEET